MVEELSMFCSSFDGSLDCFEGLAATVNSAPRLWESEATCFRAGSSALSN
jgi:hypothetical protein